MRYVSRLAIEQKREARVGGLDHKVDFVSAVQDGGVELYSQRARRDWLLLVLHLTSARFAQGVKPTL
jgi:hypothetical protein